MPIKMVINGYYRSGTTFLWRSMQKSFTDHMCFYEPLHPHLPMYIAKEKLHKKKHIFHDVNLWNEYLTLNETALSRLLAHHPMRLKAGITAPEQLFQYFDQFDNMAKEVILQPNRAHFFLNEIAQNYGCKVIHVLRNPSDVYKSIMAAYSVSDQHNAVSSFLRSVLKRYRKDRTFGIRDEFNWIKKNRPTISLSKDDNFASARQISAYQKYVAVWIISNYNAVLGVRRAKGLVCCYEELYKDKTKLEFDIASYLGNGEFSLLEIKDKNEFNIESNLKFVSTAKALGLSKEYDLLLQTAKDRGIQY